MKRQENKLEKCFLITPIGPSDSLDRFRVDQWIRLIYKPAINKKYNLICSHLISTPGVITKQIIDNIIDAELVIIDFTPSIDQHYSNPNVMYEAAIRHIAQKPVIHIAPYNLRMPFDIKDFRCIQYNKEDLNYPKKLKNEIMRAINAVNSQIYKPPDIIGHTFDLDRIVADPEKFIQILKEKIFTGNQGALRLEDALSYRGSVSSSASISPGYYKGDVGVSGPMEFDTSLSYPITCPNCESNITSIVTLGTALRYIISGAQQQYKCNLCGFLFYK